MKATIYERNGTNGLILDGLEMDVNSMSWAAVGGPAAASISINGRMTDLWQALNLARCPVMIFDERGLAVWWGYVEEAQVRTGSLEVSVSLAQMSNRVAVAYSYVAPGTTDVGERKTTAWVEDAESIAEFGYKELLSSQSGMSDAAAEGLRDGLVAALRYPQALTSGGLMPRGKLGYSGAVESQSATLYCRGWWATLGWRYASVASGDVVTTAQISSLIGAYGQFLSTVYVGTASGITASAYRDGDTSALDEVEALMAAGGANGRRLKAWVDEQKRVFIDEEEAPTAASLFLDRSGRVTNALGIDELSGQICGRWLKLRDVLPDNVDLTHMVNPGLQFVEGVEWSADGSWRLNFRGGVKIEDVLMGIGEG